MTETGNNDTSVIRGPATKKAGRVIPMEWFRKPPPGDSHRTSNRPSLGMSRTNRENKTRFIGGRHSRPVLPTSLYIICGGTK